MKSSSVIAILPLGATEQHGAHLPADTDSVIAGAVAQRAVARLSGKLQTRLLPVEEIGYSVEHGNHAATKTLGYAEAIERWIAIAAAQRAEGISRFVMLNAHGGNSPLMTVVATELRVRHAMLAVATSWTRFGWPEDLIAPGERAFGIHGGLIETSVMLALAPDRVDMRAAGDAPNLQRELADRFRHLRAYGPHAFGWQMTDLNPAGVAGNARAASAELGEKLLDHSVSGFYELLLEVDRFDPPWLA